MFFLPWCECAWLRCHWSKATICGIMTESHYVRIPLKHSNTTAPKHFSGLSIACPSPGLCKVMIYVAPYLPHHALQVCGESSAKSFVDNQVLGQYLICSRAALSSQERWTSWNRFRAGPQKQSEGWSSSTMKTGQGSWAYETWRRPHGDLIVTFQCLKEA